MLWAWETAPTTKTAGVLRFKIARANLLDETAVPVDPENIPTVLLWMPDMGHGSTPTSVERVDVGSFRVRNVFFIMPGRWEIRFQIKDGDTITDEAIAPFTL